MSRRTAHPLSYFESASKDLRSIGARRRLLRAIVVLSALILIMLAAFITYARPWYWFGSRRAYQWHKILNFQLSPQQAVYEERPVEAHRLLSQPADPSLQYRGDPQDATGLLFNESGDYFNAGTPARPIAAYAPPVYRALMGRTYSLVFMHQRTSKSGKSRLVLVFRGFDAPPDAANQTAQIDRSWMSLGARSDPPTRRFSFKHGNNRTIYIDLRGRPPMRLFAGQPDAKDDSHLTIRYELGEQPGTIDGWLQFDDTVKLQIRDGPALAAATQSQ